MARKKSLKKGKKPPLDGLNLSPLDRYLSDTSHHRFAWMNEVQWVDWPSAEELARREAARGDY